MNTIPSHRSVTKEVLDHLNVLQWFNSFKGIFGSNKCLDEEQSSFLRLKLVESKLPSHLLFQISEEVRRRTECHYLLSRDNGNLFARGNFYAQAQEDMESYLYEVITDCINRVNTLHRSLCDVTYVYLSRAPSSKSSRHFLDRYMIWELLGLLESKFKFHTNYLVCSLMPPSSPPSQNELSCGEIPGVVIGGFVRRYFLSKNIFIFDKIALALALQNVKRGCQSLSPLKQLKAVIDHQQAMLGQGHTIGFVAERELYLQEVKEKLDKLVSIYFGTNLQEQIPFWRVPSLSSCYEDSLPTYSEKKREIDERGAYGYIRKIYTLKYQGEVSHYADLHFKNYSIPVYSFNNRILDTKMSMECDILRFQFLNATYHKILEPFKVRGVTCANAVPYHYGRLLQPVLHGAIRGERGPFRFTGKRHNVDDIVDVYYGSEIFSLELFSSYPEHIRKNLYTFIVSGDFKAATDNMHPDLPRTFITALAKYTNLDGLWIHVLNLCLGNHRIEYPEPNDHQNYLIDEYCLTYHTVVKQVWGQLMGSPLSFPVLCLVNAAMLWVSFETYHDRNFSWSWILKHCRPLINGDDITFLSNPEHYRIWSDVCTSCGLGLSQGKNYTTDLLLNINSTSYIPEYQELTMGYKRMVNFKQLFVLNPGLIKGQAKVQDDSRFNHNFVQFKNESLLPLCDQLDECLLSADRFQSIRTQELFFDYMSDRLKKSRRSWILPRSFGGLGLPYGGFSNTQLAVALLQFEKIGSISDVPVKRTFSEYGSYYQRELVHSATSVCSELGYSEAFMGLSTPEEVEREPLPSLDMSFMDCSETERNFYSRKNNIKKSDGTSVANKKKRKNPEYNFIQYKKLKKVTNLAKRISLSDENDIFSRERLLSLLPECKLHKSGTIVPTKITFVEPEPVRDSFPVLVGEDVTLKILESYKTSEELLGLRVPYASGISATVDPWDDDVVILNSCIEDDTLIEMLNPADNILVEGSLGENLVGKTPDESIRTIGVINGLECT